MNVRCIALLVLFPLSAWAQGFAGLGTATDDFATPQRPAVFDFPADHGAHSDYRIEWWYLTANLTASDGTPYGLQWTLFRTALAPGQGDGWSSPQLWMGHAAVTTPDRHFVSERLARGGIGQAGVGTAPFEAWIDDWQLSGPDFDTLRMTASAPDFAYDMALNAQGPLVFHGDAGYSVKSAQGQASYYYSQPFYDIEGTLTLPNGDVTVTRQTDGTFYTSATWIAPDGTTTPYPDGAFQANPLSRAQVAGRDIPTHWRVTLPDRDVDVTLQAINDQAWMTTSVPYWEGPVAVSGSHTGVGYLEMTGYQ